jgi:hypothetical protein
MTPTLYKQPPWEDMGPKSGVSTSLLLATYSARLSVSIPSISTPTASGSLRQSHRHPKQLLFHKRRAEQTCTCTHKCFRCCQPLSHIHTTPTTTLPIRPHMHGECDTCIGAFYNKSLPLSSRLLAIPVRAVCPSTGYPSRDQTRAWKGPPAVWASLEAWAAPSFLPGAPCLMDGSGLGDQIGLQGRK